MAFDHYEYGWKLDCKSTGCDPPHDDRDIVRFPGHVPPTEPFIPGQQILPNNIYGKHAIFLMRRPMYEWEQLIMPNWEEHDPALD